MREYPAEIGEDRRALRFSLIHEELIELLSAMFAGDDAPEPEEGLTVIEGGAGVDNPVLIIEPSEDCDHAHHVVEDAFAERGYRVLCRDCGASRTILEREIAECSGTLRVRLDDGE